MQVPHVELRNVRQGARQRDRRQPVLGTVLIDEPVQLPFRTRWSLEGDAALTTSRRLAGGTPRRVSGLTGAGDRHEHSHRSKPARAAAGKGEHASYGSTIRGACSRTVYARLGHLTDGLVGLNIPAGFGVHNHTCRSQ